MAEVAYPSKRTFWKATGMGVVHEGFTDIDQVTSTGQPMLESDTDASTIYPPLPTSGWMEEGVVYSYNRGMVIVRQPHERTIYAPEDTPALFYVYRTNTEGAGWLMSRWRKAIRGHLKVRHINAFSHTQHKWIIHQRQRLECYGRKCHSKVMNMLFLFILRGHTMSI